MRKSAAKRRILEVADKMIRRKGYATLNVNDIAYQAEVSIGTLYYHFPKGKSSILLEIRNRIAAQFAAELEKELRKQKYPEIVMDFKDGLRIFLLTLLKFHRNNRQFIIAMEADILANIKTYLKAIENVDPDNLFLEEIKATIHPIKRLMKQLPKANVSTKGKEKQVHEVIDTLIHRHVYFGYNFGTDEEFIDMLAEIVYALLKRRNAES